MNRPRVLTIAAALILFGGLVWLLWPRGEEKSAAKSGPVTESLRQIDAHAARRPPPAVNEPGASDASDFFTFEHEGKTVTVDLSIVRRNLKSMIRKDLVNPPHESAGIPEPGVGFLSWQSRQGIGAETIKTRKCWVVDLKNPSRDDSYYLVRIFVDQETGNLMRMSGYNWSGKLEMTYTVLSWKKVGDGTIREKEATASYYTPGTKKVSSEVGYQGRP